MAAAPSKPLEKVAEEEPEVSGQLALEQQKEAERLRAQASNSTVPRKL